MPKGRPDPKVKHQHREQWGVFGQVSTNPLVFQQMAKTKTPFPAPPGYHWIFVKSFKHYRTGKTIFPKTAECFCFLVRG